MNYLKDLIEMFLGTYEKASTRETYRGSLYRLLDYIGNRPIDHIEMIDLQKYSAVLMKRYEKPATFNKDVTAIKAFFKRMEDLEIIDKSPAKKGIKKRRIWRTDRKEKAMPEAEFNKFLQYLRVNTRSTSSRKIRFVRGLALFLFLADTGCRIGGATTLKDTEINLKEGIAFVTEKGDKSRTVVFGEETANAVREWMLLRRGDKGPYLFTYRGEPIKPDNMSQFFRRLAADADVNWAAHSLRIRLGFRLAESGTPVSGAATILGHENPITTIEHYYPKALNVEKVKSLAVKPEEPRQKNIIYLDKKKGS